MPNILYAKWTLTIKLVMAKWQFLLINYKMLHFWEANKTETNIDFFYCPIGLLLMNGAGRDITRRIW